MKFLIHLIAESEVGQQVHEIACLERGVPAATVRKFTVAYCMQD